MSAEALHRQVQSDHHTNEKGRCRRLRPTACTEGRKFCAESESNKNQDRGQERFENYWCIMRNTLSEELLKDNSKMATRRRSRLQCGKPWIGWGKINWILSSRVATTRARFSRASFERLSAWCRRQRRSVLKAGPTTPRLRPRTVFGNYWFIMCRTYCHWT